MKVTLKFVNTYRSCYFKCNMFGENGDSPQQISPADAKSKPKMPLQISQVNRGQIKHTDAIGKISNILNTGKKETPQGEGEKKDLNTESPELNVSALTARSDLQTLEKTEQALTQETQLSEKENQQLIDKLQNLLPKQEFNPYRPGPYIDLDYENGLRPGSERFNAKVESIMDQIQTKTAFLNSYKETGVIEWVKAGRPDKYLLPSGVRIYEVHKAPGVKYTDINVGGTYFVEARMAVFARLMSTTKKDFVSALLRGELLSEDETVQHEVIHSLVYPKTFPKRHFGELFRRKPSVALNEVFARRACSSVAIDIATEDEIVKEILEAKDKKGKPLYKVKKDELAYAAHAIDQLITLYSIDSNVGLEKTFQEVAKVINILRDNGNKWDEDKKQFPIIQKEIDNRRKKLEIEEEEMPKLVERYKKVRKIQRLETKRIVQQELRLIS